MTVNDESTETLTEWRERTALERSLLRLQERQRVVDDIEETVDVQRRRDEWQVRIPPRFANARLADVDQPMRDTLGEWASSAPGPTTNIVLLGPVGTGKTHAGIGALRVCHDHGLSVAFAPIVEALDSLRPGGPNDATAKLMNARVLMLDDLGAERPTDWTAERMYGIVNRRWLNKLPTIVTTNLAVAELDRAVDARLLSRLVHDATAIEMHGRDRRRRT